MSETVDRKPIGRPPLDQEWAAYNRWIKSNLSFPDDEEQEHEFEDRLAAGIRPKGVKLCLAPGRDMWAFTFYLGGKQRVGFQTEKMSHAARVYDAMLVHFEKYRTQRWKRDDFVGDGESHEAAWFNRSRDEAKADLDTNGVLRLFCSYIEELLLKRGVLTTQDSRTEKARARQRVYQSKRTLAGQLCTIRDELRKYLFDFMGKEEMHADEAQKSHLSLCGRLVDMAVQQAETQKIVNAQIQMVSAQGAQLLKLAEKLEALEGKLDTYFSLPVQIKDTQRIVDRLDALEVKLASGKPDAVGTTFLAT